MHLVLSLAAVLGALAIGVVSPGPSFLMVARTAVARSRAEGVAAALGMGVGGTVFCVLALAGLTALIAAAPVAYLVFRICGALYLIFLGWKIWQGAGEPLRDAAPLSANESKSGAFVRGLLTQLSNPKTAVVYGSVFAALLPPHLPLAAMVVLPVIVFFLESTWYVIVAVALSAARPRATYLRAKAAIDRTAGSIMALLGAKLLYGAIANQ
jgi:threonine/homoserine/homoserine lactone efflux protein